MSRRPRAPKAPRARLVPAGQVPRVPVFEKRGPGRPLLLTPEVQDRFVVFLRGGITRETAAVACGISPITVQHWMMKAKSVEDVPRKREYVEFRRLVIEAEAQGRALVEGNVVAGSRKNPEVGLKWLRQRYPRDWGDHDPQLMPGTVIDNRTQNLLVLASEDIPEVTSRLLAERRAAMHEDVVTLDEFVADDAPSSTRDAGLREDVTGDPE